MKHGLYAVVSLFGVAAASVCLAQVQSSASAGQTSGSGLDPTPTRIENLAPVFVGGDWNFRYWRNGPLVRFRIHAQGDTAIQLFDDTGALKREFRLTIPGAIDSSVADVTLMPNGRLLAAVGGLDSEDRKENFIGVGEDSGDIKLIFRTNPFVPWLICAGDNNTMWAYGWQRGPDDNEVSSYKMLHQYDLNKGEIRAVLERSSMHTKVFFGRWPTELAMHCGPGNVYLFNGASGQLFKYEIASDRLTICQAPPFPEDSPPWGTAITDSGQVFTTSGGQSDFEALVRLQCNGTAGKWVDIGPGGGLRKGTQLLGINGDQLILLRPDMLAEWRRIRP